MFNRVINILVCFLLIDLSFSTHTTYYENLITTEKDRAYTYSLPTDSSAFIAQQISNSSIKIYDYIIVGSGTAGSVTASRLTERQDVSVLLLEAGGEESDFSDIPAMNIFLQGLEYNWNYKSTIQTKCCLGMINQKCSIAQGRGLGGSSIISDLTYIRGNKKDYNDWRDKGNPGWGYNSLLPLFKLSEDFKAVGDASYHGTGGYLSVENISFSHPQVDAFIKANKELGRLEVDYNGAQQLGVARTQMNTIFGRRDSVAKAFLKPARNRTNLRIETNSFVTKLLINPSTNETYGVLYNKNGISYKVKCCKEVIVSAGAINSPQLLLLSGIGPQDQLQSMGIPLVKNLAVGWSLQEHSAYFALHFVTNYTEPLISMYDNVNDYLNGVGQLTVGGNAHALAFIKTNSSDNSTQPDIQFIMSPSISFSPFVKKAYGYTDQSYNSIWAKVNQRTSFTIYVILLHPKSKGSVSLKSSSPFDYPNINSNLLSDIEGHDIETMYQGIQKAIQLLETNAFRSINASLLYAPLPACQNFVYLSREYWYCHLRQLTTSLGHPVGTCRMGPNPETFNVVNSNLQVHGIGNLRVADGSIIPLPTSGGNTAPEVVIGEKLSQMILSQL